MSIKKALVIIPTYNELENIEKTIIEVFKNLKSVKNWNCGILVVDDTSPDKTYELVKKLQKKFSKLELLINKKKAGLGGAYLKGMEYAFGKLKADLVFQFDADLSHDPTKIPLFFEKIDQGADLVLGSRYISGGSIPADWGLHRKFLSVVGNLVVRTVLTNFSVSDWTTGYRAVTKKVYQAVHKELAGDQFSGYTFQIGLLNKTVRKGFSIAEIPFHFKDRTFGKSKIGPEYIKNTLEYIMKVRLQDLLKSRILKFVIVGGIGALTQLTTLQGWRTIFPYQLAFFLAIEGAVLMNFILSNLWTFSDRKLKPTQYPAKFLQFNLASGGSILIQQAIAFLGETFVGLFALFTLPIINLNIDTGMMYAVGGILIGMFWNFFAYNKFIWKKKK
ncbi:MAG: glycosyltransferase family 2 protein [Candidatus Pacebacteria bacterium]|jgi:dolichol-phosphate mannosyltransferase|nr:glycosyltransferase family 2 protein [Candidatus Paceibacterota bacterium]MBT4651991.1 glycosyltransferase family 2 protein [Candidatus Paceibacterota bacterium]MBT6756013.1 glycosyltransferase family 2 protein [Candidatus Paceibacterota bacterium]MBT6920799.1 glycosyltransferase family 2 protein [Candidatus Paceibacterota bacterium]